MRFACFAPYCPSWLLYDKITSIDLAYRKEARMANFTKNEIKKTFIALLHEQSLNEITVKSIVERCGINRNSFYYHFQDLPALIEEIVKDEAEAIIKSYPSITTVVECFDAIVAFASSKKKIILNIYHSVSRETFDRNLMMVCERFVREYVDSALSSVSRKNKDTIIDYYKCTCFGVIMDWLEHDMAEEYVKATREIFVLKKDFALKVADFLQDRV